MTASRTMLGLGVMSPRLYKWHLEKDIQRFAHDSKGFVKDEKFAKINKAVAEGDSGVSEGWFLRK